MQTKEVCAAIVANQTPATVIERPTYPRRSFLESFTQVGAATLGLAAIGRFGGDLLRTRSAPRYTLGSGGTPFVTTAEAMFRPSPDIEKEPLGVMETRLVALLLQMDGFYRQHPYIKALQTPGSRTFGMNGYAFPVDNRVGYFHPSEYRAVMGEDSVLPAGLAKGRRHEVNYHLGFLKIVIDPTNPNGKLLYGFGSLTDERNFSLKPGQNLQIKNASAWEVYTGLSMLFYPSGKPAKGPGPHLNEIGTNPLVFDDRIDLGYSMKNSPSFLLKRSDFQF